MWSLYLDSLVSVFEMIDLVEVVMVELQGSCDDDSVGISVRKYVGILLFYR